MCACDGDDGGVSVPAQNAPELPQNTALGIGFE
jgi:hypothetical protein